MILLLLPSLAQDPDYCTIMPHETVMLAAGQEGQLRPIDIPAAVKSQSMDDTGLQRQNEPLDG